MVEQKSFTPEAAKAMGYNPEVVSFFKEKDPDLLEFMWGNGSAHYQSILKNEIDNAHIMGPAMMQITLERRVGNVAASSLLMAEYRLTHPQNPADSKNK